MSVIVGFHHVALTVRDLATSAEWYRTVLGLEELFREDGEQRQAVIFGFPGGGHAVGLVTHRRGAAAFDPTVTGLDHLAFNRADAIRPGSVARTAGSKRAWRTPASSTCRPAQS